MRSKRALHAAVVLALVAAMAAAAGNLRRATDKPYDVEVVPPAGALRWLSLGHPLLASHFYWLRTVQYIGEQRADLRGWQRLFPLVDLVTDLDPGHGYAYQVSGVVLAAANRIDESNRILEKGTRNVPTRYILPYLRAFNAFYYEGDWEAAGRWAEIAAKTPGAPEHVRQNVLAYYVKGGRAEAAIGFLENILAETKDPESRKAVEEQLRQAIFERDAAGVDAAIAAWRAKHGALPPSLGALRAAGFLDRIPPDPWGGRLTIGPDGRVRSSKHEFRFAPPPPPSPQPPPTPSPAPGPMFPWKAKP